MGIKVVLAPLRYVQGPNALLRMGEQLEVIGIKNPLVFASPSALKAIKETIAQGLDAKGIKYAFTEFGGESTWKEIFRVRDACLEGGHDAIISCGGGKTLDTGRAAAAGTGLDVGVVPPKSIEKLGAGVSCINVPTIAATDAPTSRACVVYTEQGTLETYIVVPVNPDMVLVDTSIIAKAPTQFLVSGMGDALATYFEADITYRTGTMTIAGAESSRTAQAVARLCFDILMEYGAQAKLEAEIGVPGPGLEAVVEANILLSGLGFESGGLAAAHSVANNLSVVHDHFDRYPYHGEAVAFGTLTQLIMEERAPEFLDKIFGFCKTVGLPTTFQELGFRTITDNVLRLLADAASKDVLIRSMPRATSDDEGRFYDPVEILNCLKATDAYGRAFSG